MKLIKGTLDVLVLKTLSWGTMHGYAISRSIREQTEEVLRIEEGALYPALRRMEQRGWVESYWGVTETGREARFYRMTEGGAQRLRLELSDWRRYVDAMSRVLNATQPVRWT
jgi:transcriptional regulator